MAANDVARKEFLRDELGAYLTELGKRDPRVVVVNADLSKTSRNTEFVRQYPDRAFNVGIAEQNMVSFAAGLAHEGWMPFAYTMAPFMSMRACEQCVELMLPMRIFRYVLLVRMQAFPVEYLERLIGAWKIVQL